MENKQTLIYGLAGLVIGVLGTMLWYTNTGSRMNMEYGQMMNHAGGMHDMMNGMMSGLDGKTGDAFDAAFLSEMIVHHEGAVTMAERVLEVSKRPELIKLANDIITAQNGEIQMMQDWQKAWFK